MQKQIPMLFSTAMVQALLAGRKTQTRRIIKWPEMPDWADPDYGNRLDGNEGNMWPHYKHIGFHPKNGYQDIYGRVSCPYGKPGDVIWVRETFTIIDYWLESTAVQVMYEDGKTAVVTLDKDEWSKFYNWKVKEGKKPSLFLFRSLSRIWLQVESIGVERLQDISEDDAIAEGVDPFNPDSEKHNPSKGIIEPVFHPQKSFRLLWKSINGKESWTANPWVWVVKFKVLSSTGKPDKI